MRSTRRSVSGFTNPKRRFNCTPHWPLERKAKAGLQSEIAVENKSRSKNMHVSPYLHFKGNCEEAFKFYEKALGGKIDGIMTWGATPMAKEVPPDWQNKIIHARLVLDGQDVYGSDAPPQFYQQPQGFSVSLTVKQVAEAERTFKALAENGTVKMPF